VEINILDQAGDVFGEMAILDGTARSASLYAIDETVCLATDASYLDRLSDNDRIAFTCILYHVFAELLSNRLRAMDEELVKVKEENQRLKGQLNKRSV
jgi:CRP-like cAMP-binding protein